MPSPAAVIPSPAQDAPRPSGASPPIVPDQEDVSSKDLEKKTAEDGFRDLPNKGVTQEEVVDDDLIDSAFEARDNDFKEKRAYFEQRSRSEVEERAEINSTARMKPTLESQRRGDGHGSPDTNVGMHEQHLSQSGPLRTTEHPTGEGVFSTNKSLSRVNSGRSWILELNDTGQASASATLPDDIAFEEEAPVNNDEDNPPFFSGACVVRRVFRAESLADESESSDGSVISVEINSGPRDANDDGHSSERALEWYFSTTRKKPNDSMTTTDHQ